MFTNNANGTPEPPICTLLTGSSLTTIYTATDDAYTLAIATFAHNSGGSVDCELYWRENGSAVDALIWIGAVNTKTVNGTGNSDANFPVRLRAGDIIKAKAANGVWVNLILTANSRMRNA
jgi:hypothetical protein